MDEPTTEKIEPPGYEIRVRGILGDRLLMAFPDLAAVTDDGDTLLTGRPLDQSALHGVLGHIESLGLELVEIRRR
jgi:hypothetical protein